MDRYSLENNSTLTTSKSQTYFRADIRHFLTIDFINLDKLRDRLLLTFLEASLLSNGALNCFKGAR